MNIELSPELIVGLWEVAGLLNEPFTRDPCDLLVLVTVTQGAAES